MTNPHPNATVAAGSSSVGLFVVWLLGNILHISLSAEDGAAVAGVIGTVALLVGRHGLKGLLELVWKGKPAGT